MNLPTPPNPIMFSIEPSLREGNCGNMFDRKGSKEAADLERSLGQAISRGSAKGAIKVLEDALAKTSQKPQWLRVAAQQAARSDQLPALRMIIELGRDLPQKAGRERVDLLIALGVDDFQRWCGGDSRAGLVVASAFAPKTLKWALEASPPLVFRKDETGMSVLACACLNENDSRPFDAAMAAGAAAVAAGEASGEKWIALMASAAVLMVQKNMPPDLAMGRLSAMDAQGLDWRQDADRDGMSVFGASVIGVENEELALALLAAGASASSPCPNALQSNSGKQTAIGALFNHGNLIWAYKTKLAKALLNALGDDELVSIVSEGVVPGPSVASSGRHIYYQIFEQEIFGRLASISERKSLEESIPAPSANAPRRPGI